MHLGCEYVPDLVWFSAASSKGQVIAFTGAQLWLKVDRQTDILTVLSDVPGKSSDLCKGSQKYCCVMLLDGHAALLVYLRYQKQECQAIAAQR